MSHYIPHSAEETQEMLEYIGVKSLDDLYPVDVVKDLKLEPGKNQAQVEHYFKELSGKNKIYKKIFRGAGAYKHYTPPAVRALSSREEFVTAYTPYQPEMNQGILQATFEYQSMICTLTGMELSNASLYDGGTAVADAIVMSLTRKKKKVLVSECVEPNSRLIAETYLKHFDVEMVTIPADDYATDISKIDGLLDDSVAAIVMQQPNRYGTIEDCEAVGKIAEKADSQFIMSVNPIALGLLKTPKECGATIAVGEGQPLGLSLGGGGPYLGFIGTVEKNLRKIPGRIVGESVDAQNRQAFVLTLQAREQHIRREKASSSICSNQALCALTAGMFMAAYGKQGFKTIGTVSASNAHYFADQLKGIGLSVKNNGEFFHEFVASSKGKNTAIIEALEKHDVLAGLPLSDDEMLWCVTETVTKQDMDEVITIIKEAIA